MVDYRKLKIGQPVLFFGVEFDGEFKVNAVVTKVEEDHAIARGDDMNLWIDDRNADLFKLL